MYENTTAPASDDSEPVPFQPVQYSAQVYFSQCLWWDAQADDDQGAWSSSGCQVPADVMSSYKQRAFSDHFTVF